MYYAGFAGWLLFVDTRLFVNTINGLAKASVFDDLGLIHHETSRTKQNDKKIRVSADIKSNTTQIS